LTEYVLYTSRREGDRDRGTAEFAKPQARAR
jgi:hypothetical protein